MKKYFLLGLTALGLVALTPIQSKADDGLRIYVNPGYQQVRPYYYGDDQYRYYRHVDEYRWQRWVAPVPSVKSDRTATPISSLLA